MNPPSIALTMLDIPRGLSEQLVFFWRNVLSRPAESGDGGLVILLPGLGADEWQMYGLRDALRKRGYDAHTWGMGRNWGARTTGHNNGLLVDRLWRYGEPVTLIGWSLGGLQARLVAADFPRLVRQVITLGSPFVGRDKATNIGWLYSLLTGEALDGPEADAIHAKLAKPLRVPALSIYSRSDGVVAAEGCIDPTGQTRHVEVRGAHTGLATNSAALRAIVRALRDNNGENNDS